MLLLVTESLPSCSSGGLLEDVFAVRLIHITAVLDSLLLLLSRGQLLLLLFGSMPSSPVGRIRFMLQVALGGNNDAGRQSAAGSRLRPRCVALGNLDFPFLLEHRSNFNQLRRNSMQI